MDYINVSCEYIYLIREREFVNLNAPVFKIGRTVNCVNRMNQYPKGSEIYLIVPVTNSVWYEKQLLDIFDDHFERATVNNDGQHYIGREYYIGNLDEMVYIINTFIQNHYPGHFVTTVPTMGIEYSDTTFDNTETYYSDYE